MIREISVISGLFMFGCEDNTYNLLVQRNYLQKQSPIAFLQKCVLQICSKFTGEDPCGNVISRKGIKVTWHFCKDATVNLLRNCAEHLFRRTPLGDCFCVLYNLFWASNK